ncbi:hypothetical protein [Streptomyces sp. NPDC058297]|uniref:hypothetical protein n=1 Tax=Streptomyces sp. NPDC058297 TaxID=3346433 RepID=UPI0036EA57FC
MNQSNLDDIATRIAYAAEQFTPSRRPNARQKADAAAVLRDMVQATATHGLGLADFDGIADFPRMAIQLVQHRDEQRQPEPGAPVIRGDQHGISGGVHHGDLVFRF